MRNLLVVVDMVNGFINEGALADKKINKITPVIENLIKSAKANGTNIVAFKDCHVKGDPEFKLFPEHCVKGTNESELIPELKKYEKDMVIIEKNTTNGFATNKFKQIASAFDFDNVYVVGCCTDICVKGFVESYLKFNKKNNRRAKITVIEDACYTFDGANHNAEQEHQKAVNYMKNLGANIISVNKNKEDGRV